MKYRRCWELSCLINVLIPFETKFVCSILRKIMLYLANVRQFTTLAIYFNPEETTWRDLSSYLPSKLLDIIPRIYLSTSTIFYFLCPNLGNLSGTVIRMTNTDKITVMMKVALRDEA
jgi:hypothetical protein